MGAEVAVVGAGMVGVAIALELKRRGRKVTLIDRREPGRETSFGNAGVISPSSFIPFNHPGLWRTLPRLLGNRSAELHYHPAYVARHLGWALGFLRRANRADAEATGEALHPLIMLSLEEHRRLLQEAGESGRLRETGWLHLYRSGAGFERAKPQRETLARFGVRTEVLGPAALADLEPHLKPVFPRALWLKDAASVDNPGAVVTAYARRFTERGGRIVQVEVADLERSGDRWVVIGAGGQRIEADDVVVALGPWSGTFLARQGLRVPLAYERGYHMHYGAEGNAILGRPVLDVAGAYLLTPMEQGLRLTTGVELGERDAPPSPAQLGMAEASARTAFPLAARLQPEPWLGRRPTLPDSRPIIGRAPGRPGLWLAFGHQHIGFMTGPGTAALLGALMTGDAPPLDPAPFRAERFLHG